MDVVKADRNNFISFAVESVLWGCHLVIFSLALSVLLDNRRRMSMNKFLFSAMIVLFTFCTTHFILTFIHIYTGLMVSHNPIHIETPVLLSADFLIFVTDCTSQIVLIYRCWLVWQKSYLVVLLPFLMSLTSLSCGLATGIIYITTDPTAYFAPAVAVRLGEVAIGMPLATNILVTGLIIGRILFISRGTNLLPSKGLQAAVAVVIESGTLIVVVQIAFCVFYALQDSEQNIFAWAAEQIYGIAPTLIVLRVGMGNAIDTNKTKVTTVGTKSTRVAFFVKKQKYCDPELASFGPGSGTTGVDTRTTKSDF